MRSAERVVSHERMRGVIVAAFVLLVSVGAACERRAALPGPKGGPSSIAMREDVTLTTADRVRIAGHWYTVGAPNGWALLLHMMPATKESYAALAGTLQQRGIASLAIDFRGHGESYGGPRGYERFTDAEQQAKIRDVEAAVTWLRDHSMREPQLVLVGASIGANLALQFVRDSGPPSIAGAVLLSPGLEYRGVQTDAIARMILTEEAQRAALTPVPVLLAAGGADDEYSTGTVRTLAEILGTRATVRTFPRAGHGTTMFEREPAFLTEVADWIARHASP